MFIRNPSEIYRLQRQFSHLKPTNILICAYNLNDGIGDCRNALDAYRDIKKIAANHHVKLMITGEYDELEKMIEISKYVMPESKISIIELDMSSDKKIELLKDVNIEKADIVFFIGNNEDDLRNCRDALSCNNTVRDFLGNTYLALNISTCLECSNVDELFRMLPDKCKINSLVEYSTALSQPSEESFKFFHHEDKTEEIAMGIQKKIWEWPYYEAGLKLNSDIYERSLMCDHKDKAQLLEFLSPPLLATIMGMPLDSMISREMKEKYFSDTLLAVGYVKGEWSRCYLSYALLGLAQHKNVTHIDLIMQKDNRDHYLNFYDLSSFTIVIADSESNKIETYGNGQIQLKIISPNKMISPKDMEILTSASDLVGASGDNSVSDVLSAKTIPFIAPLCFKKQFIESLIEYMREECQDNTDPLYILSKYYDLLLHSEMNDAADVGTIKNQGEKIRQFVAEHADSISMGTQHLTNLLFANKHVEKYFIKMIDQQYGHLLKIAPISAEMMSITRPS